MEGWRGIGGERVEKYRKKGWRGMEGGVKNY
jgi:hypothetical protein